jgi:hypothetical protein
MVKKGKQNGLREESCKPSVFLRLLLWGIAFSTQLQLWITVTILTECETLARLSLPEGRREGAAAVPVAISRFLVAWATSPAARCDSAPGALVLPGSTVI